jgi:hypothetical protein
MRRFPSPPNLLSHKERGGTGRIRKRPISFRTWVLSAPEPTCARVHDGGYPAFCLRVDSREPAPAKARGRNDKDPIPSLPEY